MSRTSYLQHCRSIKRYNLVSVSACSVQFDFFLRRYSSLWLLWTCPVSWYKVWMTSKSFMQWGELFSFSLFLLSFIKNHTHTLTTDKETKEDQSKLVNTSWSSESLSSPLSCVSGFCCHGYFMTTASLVACSGLRLLWVCVSYSQTLWQAQCPRKWLHEVFQRWWQLWSHLWILLYWRLWASG